MFVQHFERLRPLCPYCRVVRQLESPLRIGQIAREEDGEILEGALLCTQLLCQREHPIIDGIPVLVADPSSWAATQLNSVLCRDDLTPFTLSLLGDLSGHGSNFDHERGNNGIYAHSHWSQNEASYMGLFEAASQLLATPPQGMWLDIGASVGRGTFELAAATGDLAVGIDLNFSMLRIAQRIRRTGRIRYSLRRVGLAFDVHDYSIAAKLSEQVSFWCADVALLPFADATFAGVLCMNMLDCVQSPLGLLLEMGRVTAPGSESILCTPFDWAAGATAPAAWIGGHSQRSPHEGSSLLELRRILSVASEAGVETGLHIEAEADKVKWRLRTHERSVTEYDVYLARLRHKG